MKRARPACHDAAADPSAYGRLRAVSTASRESPAPEGAAPAMVPTAEETSRRQERLSKALLDNMTDVIVLMSAEGLLRYVSPGIQALCGYHSEELADRAFADFVHADDLPRCDSVMQELLSSPASRIRAELRCRCKDGNWRLVEALSRNLVQTPDVGGIIVELRDITGRKAEQEEKSALAAALRSAIDREEFVLHYQPRVNLRSGVIHGVEALIRWNRPGVGLAPPAEFIPELERTGMIVEVGRWALHRAMADHRAWRAAGLGYVPVAVNVSAVQLRQEEFVDMVREVVQGAEPGRPGIELELTESTLMADSERVVRKLKAIRALDVLVAIDDFGTGYSSLAYLARLPIDSLKIDRSFTSSLLDGQGPLSVVSAITALGKSLHLSVIAEGVESAEHVDLLRRVGCEEAQGFLFSRAVPSAELSGLLQRGAIAVPSTAH